MAKTFGFRQVASDLRGDRLMRVDAEAGMTAPYRGLLCVQEINKHCVTLLRLIANH
jgi:hypothetical protein